MGLNRYAKKRDANEREIIDVLQKNRVEVFQLDKPGDLLCWHMAIFTVLEVKDEKGRLTDEQKRLEKAGIIKVVRNPTDALRALAII